MMTTKGAAMAKREILGTMPCPECDFDEAEVKPQKNPELCYRWCPECNAQYFPRSPETSARLLAKVGVPPISVPAKSTGPDVKEPPDEPEPKTAKPKSSMADALSFLGAK